MKTSGNNGIAGPWKLSVPALIILALAVLMAIGSATFLGPCVHEDGSFGACHWAGKALLGIGLLMAVQALLALALRSHAARLGLFMAMVPTAALGVFIPGTLIDLCRMDTMRCRAVMQPSMALICAAVAIAALAGCAVEYVKYLRRTA